MATHSRKETQERRERNAVEWCAEWHSQRTHTHFSALPRGDSNEPPDGFIVSKGTTRWVEVVSVTMNPSFDRYSHEVGDGENPDLPLGPYLEPDRQFAFQLVHRIRRKILKASYVQLVSTYGRGLLVADAFYPLFTRYTMTRIAQLVDETGTSLEGSHFADGVLLVNPYHNGARISLRKLLRRPK